MGEPQVTPSGGRRWILAATVALTMATAVLATVGAGAPAFRAAGLDEPANATALIATLLQSVVALAASACLGAVVIAILQPRRGAQRLLIPQDGPVRLGRRAALVWALAAGSLVLVDGVQAQGRPLSGLTEPAVLHRVLAPALPKAWLVVVGCAALTALSLRLARTWSAAAVTLTLAGLGALAPAVVGHVMLGPDHDFGTDATILGAPAAAMGFGAVLALKMLARLPASGTLMRRVAVLAATCWGVVVVTLVVRAVVQTEGSAFLASASGRWFAVQAAVVAVIGLLGLAWWRGRRSGRDAGQGEDAGQGRAGAVPAGTGRFLAITTVLVGVYLGTEVALARIPPPQSPVGRSIPQDVLGFDLPVPVTPVRLALSWRLNLLFTALALLGIAAYLVGVRRLTARGDRWPIGRTLCWLLGWLFVVTTTSSGVGRYAGAEFSVHMALHMSLNMFAPPLLVLGGPITLLLRAFPGRGPDRPAGVHEWTTALLRWRPSRAFAHPLHALISYTTSYYILYFSPLFDQASRYQWARQATNLEFLLIGYLFFSLVIGVDPPPHPLPHLGKFGLVLAAMPFHTFFGVVVMSTKGIIARPFYEYLHQGLPWSTDLSHDQWVGGGIAWASGEIPLTFVILVLLVQWARQDSRQAARVDRHLDAGLDDSYDAYNRMLARLAAADARAGRPPDGT